MRRQTVRQLVLSATMITGFFLSGTLSPPGATATTYYVATDGNDADSGTQEQPFQTIRHALSVIGAGDTLYLREGTYAEYISSDAQTIPTGTSWDDAPLIASYPGETAVLQGWMYLMAPYIQYLIFDGIIVDAGQNQIGGAVYLGSVHNLRMQNGEVKNAPESGITTWFATETSSIEFLNLKIHHNGRSFFDHGLYITTGNNLVEGCDIYSNSGYGIHIYSGGKGGTDNNIIRNNAIYDNGSDSGAGGVTIGDGDGILFENNLVYNNFKGIDVNKNVSNTQIYNNTIHNNSPSAGIEVSRSSIGAIIKDNTLYQNGSAIVDAGVGTILTNNLLTGP